MLKLKQSQIKLLFDYKDGELYWKDIRSNRATIGEKVDLLKPDGYLRVDLKEGSYAVHRLIWIYHFGHIPEGHLIDHKDHDKLNNNIDNLRIATPAQNLANMKVTQRGSSVYKGVSYYAKRNKWQANIRQNGKSKHLGYFESEQEAALYYNTAAIVLFGEFAKLNTILPGDADEKATV